MGRTATLGRCIAKGGGAIDLEDLDAFILDMDGVVTDTASIHAAAWKQTLDSYLRERAARSGEVFVPFETNIDYLRYVDGKPRYDGVRSFLESRHISIPDGTPRDPPEQETVYGIGNRKNALFLEQLEIQGVEPYPESLRFIRRLRARGTRVALISASRNAKKVLEKAGLTGLFDAVVDGIDAKALGLKGKPAPDIFLEAARRLKVSPEMSAIIEDALAGVEAGKAGGFAVVIGVDRVGQESALRDHGADVVVKDLSEIPIGDGAEEGIAFCIGRGGEPVQATAGGSASDIPRLRWYSHAHSERTFPGHPVGKYA